MERPEPAVGQVWRTSGDGLYLIAGEFDDIFKLVYQDEDCLCMDAIGTVAEDHTYVGLFDGFKVKETT